MAAIRILSCLVVASACLAGTVHVPGNTLLIPALNPSGASFSFSGTLSQNDTIDLTLSGTGCLQSGGTYCTNAAGVVVVAGTTGVGGTSSFTGPIGGFTHTYNFGSVIMLIAGVGAVQLFQANAANGLGSGSPPTSLTLATTSLSALGFGSFSVTNPTISFIIADTFYPDNSGTLTLTQTASPPSVPAPPTLELMVIALSLVAMRHGIRNRYSLCRPNRFK
jgi:hypothetical protein